MKTNSAMAGVMLRDHPLLGLGFFRAFIRGLKARVLDYRRRDGASAEIPLLTINITPLCNLRCRMCGQRGVQGTLKGADALEKAKSIVPADRYLSLLDEIRGKTDVLYVWGGEPFLYPGFMDLAGAMARKMPVFAVNTNGTYLAENAERIVEDRWQGILISLDGFEDVNDEIRGKGSYRKVLEGIERIRVEKERKKTTMPYLGIVSTISNMNYMHLDRLVEDLSHRGLDWHVINLGTYTTAAIGAAHRAHMQERLGIDAGYWRGFATGYNEGIDGQAFAGILDRIHAMDTGYPILTVPVIDPRRIGAYYADLALRVRDRCLAPWVSANINFDGEVYFCADYPEWSLGNIKDHGFLELYNNERARRFRRELRGSEDGIFPGCTRCYQLNLCGRRRRGF